MLTISGEPIPQLLFSPSSGATKSFSLFQNGDVAVFSDTGVANRAFLDLATGTFSLQTGGLVVEPPGQVRSVVGPGLSATQFRYTGINGAICHVLDDNPGVSGAAPYQMYFQRNTSGVLLQSGGYSIGFSDAATEQTSYDLALRHGGTFRTFAVAGIPAVSGLTGAPMFIGPGDGTGPWVIGQEGQGITRLRMENSSSGSNTVAMEMRNTAVGVTSGGLWRVMQSGAAFAIQMNTAAGGDFSSGNNYFVINGSTGAVIVDTLAATGPVTSSSPSAGIGYATGAGGAVTQATSKSTGVTLNKVSGTITMNNAALSSFNTAGFTLTNSTIAATDVVVVSIKSGGSANSYVAKVGATAAGSCVIELFNTTGATLSEAVVLNFVVIKGVAS